MIVLKLSRRRLVGLLLAVLAALMFASHKWLLNALSVGVASDQPLDVYSARVVDLSLVDIQKATLVGTDQRVRWLTTPPIGVALWQPSVGRFLVFPFCEAPGYSPPSVLSLNPDELPKASKRLFELLPKGKHLHCRGSNALSIDIRMSGSSDGVGRIEVWSNEQGLSIDYEENGRYLF